MHFVTGSILEVQGKEVIMTLKVIGAGFGRTGTLSLKHALETLGFNKCYHMMEVGKHDDHRSIWRKAHAGEEIDWEQLFEGYQATVDWPSCNLWREQLAHFPGAKVILTLRSPESWYQSVMATIYASSKAGAKSDNPTRKYDSSWAFDLIWNRIFANQMNDREQVIDAFNRHNEQVIAEVPAGQLLVFEAHQGWGPLCDFLMVPIPETDYPKINTTEQFKEIWRNPDLHH